MELGQDLLNQRYTPRQNSEDKRRAFDNMDLLGCEVK